MRIISINKIKFDEQSDEKSAKLILETMVGRGGVLGKSFQELRKVYDSIKEKDRIGFCIDTCHVFAEGLYDLRKKEEIDKIKISMNKYILFSLLVVIGQAAQVQATEFVSPGGVHEECKIAPHIPDGEYSSDDEEDFFLLTIANVALQVLAWGKHPVWRGC